MRLRLLSRCCQSRKTVISTVWKRFLLVSLVEMTIPGKICLEPNLHRRCIDIDFHLPKEVRMFFRFRIAMGMALLLALAAAIPAFAGGWAVITLDELPMDVVAGEPLTVGFTVRQHGRTPMDGLEPTITAHLYKEEFFEVEAEPGGKPGHYTATLTFPREGDWNWSIQAFSMDQPMPVLSVAAPVASASNRPVVNSEPATISISPLLIVRAAAFGNRPRRFGLCISTQESFCSGFDGSLPVGGSRVFRDSTSRPCGGGAEQVVIRCC